jgi:hypothetical protein
MQIITGILNRIGRLRNRGCFGKLIVSVLALLLIGNCAAPSAMSVPTEVPTPRLPPPIPPLPPPTFNACQDDPNPDAAPNHPVLIAAIDKDAETVTLTNVGPDPVDLAGWHLCSVKGNQEHPISGTLAPGEQKDFRGPAGDIWSSSDTDNGSLYNAQGQLVSYFNS